MDFDQRHGSVDLNKREFRDTVRLRHDWPIPDNPSVCVCGSMFTVDHAISASVEV